MRPEHQRMEEIDLYLKNKMTAEMRTSFEARMETDPVLREDVEVTRILIEGIKLNYQAEQITQGFKRYLRMRRIKYQAAVALAILSIAAACWFIVKASRDNAADNTPALQTIDNALEPVDYADTTQKWKNDMQPILNESVSIGHDNLLQNEVTPTPASDTPPNIATVDTIVKQPQAFIAPRPDTLITGTEVAQDSLAERKPGTAAERTRQRKAAKTKNPKQPLPEYDLKHFDKYGNLIEKKKSKQDTLEKK